MKSKNEILQSAKLLLSALLAYMAIKIQLSPWIYYAANGQEFDLYTAIFPYSIYTVISYWGCFLLIKRSNWKLLKKPDKVSIVVFAIFLFLGYLYIWIGTMFAPFYTPILLVWGALCLCGNAILLATVFCYLKELWSFLFGVANCNYVTWFDKHLRWISTILMVVCWTPYAIVKYPAGIHYDSTYMIDQFLNNSIKTSFWPPFLSFLMGGVTRLGYIFFDSYNVGIMTYVVIQMILCAVVFSHSLCWLQKKKICKNYIYFCLFIYLIIPVVPSFATSVGKDMPYSMCLLGFVVLFSEMLYEPSKYKAIELFVCIILLGLMSHKGVYVLYAETLLIILCWMKDRFLNKFTMLTLVCGIVLVIFYSHFLLPYMGISPITKAVPMSPLFQQTARYVKLHPEDVTDYERETIDNVLEYEKLAEVYDPIFSDPVYCLYKENDDALKEYIKVWASQFARHPDIYIDATFHNCFGFFWPNTRDESNLESGFYIGSISDIGYNSPFTYNERFLNFAECFSNIIDGIERFAPLAALSNTTIYIFLAIWCFFWTAFNHSRKMLYIIIVPIVCMAILVVSPSYFHWCSRYALPIYIIMPSAFGALMCERQARIESKLQH